MDVPTELPAPPPLAPLLGARKRMAPTHSVSDTEEDDDEEEDEEEDGDEEEAAA